MKISKHNLPHYLNAKSSINDILIALGMCSSLEVKMATIEPAGAEKLPLAAYLQAHVDTVLVPDDLSEILLSKGVISTREREYALAVHEFFRTEWTPAAQFLYAQEVLRGCWSKLLGGEVLDEASAEVSNFPYASKQTHVAGE